MFVDFEPAYNLLINLILKGASVTTLLPQVISNLSNPPPFSHGPSLSIAILSTIFNIIPQYPALQLQVFRTILSISQANNLYDYVSPYFKSLNQWLRECNVPNEEQTQIWAIIISMAEKAKDEYQAFGFVADDRELYNLLQCALSVAPLSEVNPLIMKIIRAGIDIPYIFDFSKLVALHAFQQFQKDNETAYEFLQIYLTGNLETYRMFIKSHPTWLADNRIHPFQRG